MKYKVKNIMKDSRKFYDGDVGKDVIVRPGETVITERPPSQKDVWEIDEEKKEEFIKIKTKK